MARQLIVGTVDAIGRGIIVTALGVAVSLIFIGAMAALSFLIGG